MSARDKAKLAGIIVGLLALGEKYLELRARIEENRRSEAETYQQAGESLGELANRIQVLETKRGGAE